MRLTTPFIGVWLHVPSAGRRRHAGMKLTPPTSSSPLPVSTERSPMLRTACLLCEHPGPITHQLAFRRSWRGPVYPETGDHCSALDPGAARPPPKRPLRPVHKPLTMPQVGDSAQDVKWGTVPEMSRGRRDPDVKWGAVPRMSSGGRCPRCQVGDGARNVKRGTSVRRQGHL